MAIETVVTIEIEGQKVEIFKRSGGWRTDYGYRAESRVSGVGQGSIEAAIRDARKGIKRHQYDKSSLVQN